MKFTERFLNAIFKFPARGPLKRFNEWPPERALHDSEHLLTRESLQEITAFVTGKQLPSGGFVDKGGKEDLYYSLFGYLVAESLGIQNVTAPIKEYIRQLNTSALSGIHLHCYAIMQAKLFGRNSVPAGIKKMLAHPGYILNGYAGFINLLTFFYLHDLYRLYKISTMRKMNLNNLPCTVLSAIMVQKYCFGEDTGSLARRIRQFYGNDGSFRAVEGAPAGDLLTTAVALYALKSVHEDLREIVPDCMNYVDSLYLNGGFSASPFDRDTDIEYTFYGLLALGALAK